MGFKEIWKESLKEKVLRRIGQKTFKKPILPLKRIKEGSFNQDQEFGIKE